MEISYCILARSEEQVQGINVSLSVEFEKGSLPTNVMFNAATTIPVKEQELHMSVSGDYNVDSGLFTNFNSYSLPSGFIVKLETIIKEFFDQVVANQAL